MIRWTSSGVCLAALTLVLISGVAPAAVGDDQTPAHAGEQVGVEGTFVRVAANDEGWVVVGYRVANESVGEDYMLLRVGMTLTDASGTQKITRDDIKLVTPEEQVLPLMTQHEAEQARGSLATLTKRDAMTSDSIDYFPPGADRPCKLQFFAAQAGPRPMVADDEVNLAGQEACVGYLYFHIPGGIQYGNYNLDVKFDDTIVKVPMEIMNKDREKEFTKQWKETQKEARKQK